MEGLGVVSLTIIPEEVRCGRQDIVCFDGMHVLICVATSTTTTTALQHPQGLVAYAIDSSSCVCEVFCLNSGSTNMGKSEGHRIQQSIEWIASEAVAPCSFGMQQDRGCQRLRRVET